MRTTVVGSHPIPDWLKSLPNEPTMVDAMIVAMHDQEHAGIDVIGDGEIGRWDLQRNAPGGMVERFVSRMDGVQWPLNRRQRAIFAARPEMRYRQAPPGAVVGELGEGLLDLAGDWSRAKALTHRPLKFTLTSPYLLAKVVADDHYGSTEKLAMAFADVLAGQVRDIDAAVIQIDEPHLTGHPEDHEIAAAAINRVIAAATTTTAVHLCFGNYDGQMIQSGSYARLVAFLNALRCDHLVLETTRRSRDELAMLRDVDPRLRLGLGVIDVKDLQVETADQVARRIDVLADLLGAPRIAWVHPDCGLRHLPRQVACAKLRALVAGRDVYLSTRSGK